VPPGDGDGALVDAHHTALYRRQTGLTLSPREESNLSDSARLLAQDLYFARPTIVPSKAAASVGRPMESAAHWAGIARGPVGNQALAWRTSGAHPDGKQRERRGRRWNPEGSILQAVPAISCPSRPACSHAGPPRQDGVSPSLPPGLLGEPVVEHGAREADVPTYSMAGQATGPHGLIDPARLDVEIPGGLLWAKESILRQGGWWLCCRCWSLHALYRPPTARTGQRIWPPPRRADSARSVGAQNAAGTSRREPPRPRGGPPEKSVEKS
jgi:hypothetical protein